jgi:hypothetical protein
MDGKLHKDVPSESSKPLNITARISMPKFNAHANWPNKAPKQVE